MDSIKRLAVSHFPSFISSTPSIVGLMIWAWKSPPKERKKRKKNPEEMKKELVNERRKNMGG